MGSKALLLVDLQKGFDVPKYWGSERNNPMAEENCICLLNHFRDKGFPVIHVRHGSTTAESPLNPNHPGFEYKDGLSPAAHEVEFTKKVNSAFIGTGLQAYLLDNNINTLFIVGLTTDHCISTSTRMSGNLGFNTYLVEDATATFNKKGTDGTVYSADLIHKTALASLNEEFASVIQTKKAIELLK